MGRSAVEINICLLAVSSMSILYILNRIVIESDLPWHINSDYIWFSHFCINILNYSTIFIPGYLVFRYLKTIQYNPDSSANGCVPFVFRICLGENSNDYVQNQSSTSTSTHQRSIMQETVLLVLCFLGLQMSYLTWGVLQEKVMTQEYENDKGEKSHFKDSQFLVLVNRVLAFCVSAVVLLFTRQPKHEAPLYKYVFCSFSNILSSWCQYEALKYVSFPSQVLAKASKVIPVMIMSKVVSRTKYEYYEYITAGVLSIGMVFFMLDTEDSNKSSSVTTISGLILLACYILFDSFTSNWQGALFKTYGMSSVQMMCAVNLFSCLFTANSLIQQHGIMPSLQFMIQFPPFVMDCLLLSLCSALGQLVIFFTIATFGAVVFTIIMTMRQAFAILLSCLIYHHHISWSGMFGIILVFLAVFLRIYCNQRIRLIRKRAVIAATVKI